MPVDTVRDGAIDVILRVFRRGMRLDAALDRTLRRRKLTNRGRRFLTQLAYGVVRHKRLCDHILADLVHQPLDDLPLPILAVLELGVFQALYCRQVTFPAMVHTSVDLAKKRGHAGTARLVNAVLKRAPQSLDAVDLPPRSEPARYLEVRWSLPGWLASRWLRHYGIEGAEALCRACDEEAPRAIRVNTLRGSAEGLIAMLQRSGETVDKTTDVPEEITLASNKKPIARSKAFQQGLFMIQDPASMLPPHLLEPEPGQRVLDMCAAPGGKTTHIAQLMGNSGFIVAADPSPARLKLVRENAERLGIGGLHLVAADGTRAPLTGGFQRVLVDAPCSGLGTLRRHPGLKWRLDEDAPARMGRLQAALLRSAVELCENSGVIVYSVCTFTEEETEAVVNGVIADGGVQPEDGPAWLEKWKVNTGQYVTRPDRDGLDGFFLTRLRKVS